MASWQGRPDNIGEVITTPGDLLTRRSPGDLVRLPVGSNGRVLTADSSTATGLNWFTNGVGDLLGPVSSTNNAIARFNGTDGKSVKSSAATLSDAGDLATASITTPAVNSSAGLTLVTASNDNITLSPNGTGTVVCSKALTVPAGSVINFGTNGRIANNSNNSFAFQTNGGGITGTGFGVDFFYANTFFNQVSGNQVFTTSGSHLTFNGNAILGSTGQLQWSSRDIFLQPTGSNTLAVSTASGIDSSPARSPRT